LPILISQTLPSFQTYATQIIYSEIQNEINPLNAELNPICHLLALLGAHHIFHVTGLRVKYLYVKKQRLKQQHLLSATVSQYAQ